jgi:hypothetical protein
MEKKSPLHVSDATVSSPPDVMDVAAHARHNSRRLSALYSLVAFQLKQEEDHQ